ncbi:hypothetical protein K4F52_003161 [Lecanicillium sp. MT-2017a]|nr:hypothetical protein K4F52_003161 [Lecanicillium sp. MT-2017a]
MPLRQHQAMRRATNTRQQTIRNHTDRTQGLHLLNILHNTNTRRTELAFRHRLPRDTASNHITNLRIRHQLRIVHLMPVSHILVRRRQEEPRLPIPPCHLAMGHIQDMARMGTGPSSPPGKTATPAAAKAPAPPPAPGTGALSLPPKPPKSVHEFQGPIQDHRNNKRKNDRQNRNRDNRDNRDNKQRDQSARNQGSPKRPQNAQNRRPSQGQHNQQPDRRGQRPGSKDGHVPAQGGHASPPASLQRRQSSNGSDSTRTATIPPSASPLERPSTQDSAKAEPASSNHGVSSSILDKPNPSLPPKPVVTAENLPPVKIDVGPESAKAPVEYERRDDSLSRRAEEPDSDQHSDSRSQRNGARSRDPHSDSEDSRNRPVKRMRRDSRERRRSPSPARYRDDDDDLPRRDTSRSRSRQRQPSVGSHRSRSSSASSRSSGLDSLEAELLGRPVKRSMSGGSDMKKKAERSMPTKVKKRRQTNSAFSRRW